MSVPNYFEDVKVAKAKYPEAWKQAHTGSPQTEAFIRLLAKALHAKDPKVSLNGKRGNPLDLSDDCVNILCDAADSAGRTPEGLPCVVVDVIGGAGGPNPVPTWSVYNTLVEGSGAPVDPGNIPMPQPPAQFPYPDEGTLVKAFQDRVKAAYVSVGRIFPDPNDSDAYRHFSRYGYDCRGMDAKAAADKHIAELRQQLGAPAE